MFMRGSGPWSYPVVNLIHILGVAALFGAVLILDLRLLAVWRRTPLLAIATATAPVAMAGFALAAAGGVCLLASNALEYQNNAFLLVKFAAIGRDSSTPWRWVARRRGGPTQPVLLTAPRRGSWRSWVAFRSSAG
jgi:hypothetical protein